MRIGIPNSLFTPGVYGSGTVSCPVCWGHYANTSRSSYATIFAAVRKHALYHTIEECDWGALVTDSCDSNMYNMHIFLRCGDTISSSHWQGWPRAECEQI
jgi:hypothetical protein